MKFNKFNKTGTKVQKDNNGTSRFSSESPGRTSGVLTALKSLAGLSLLLSACATVATVPPGAAVESSKIPAVETSVASAAQNNTDVGRLAELWEQRRKQNFASDYPLGPGDAIKSGAQPDVPLREGDVINVVSYGPKLFAYGFYRFFTTVFNVGASANIPIR